MEKCGQAEHKKRDDITSILLSTKLCCDFYFTHCSWSTNYWTFLLFTSTAICI